MKMHITTIPPAEASGAASPSSVDNPFRRFASAGYERLVAITPPGAPVSPKSSLFKRQEALGKAPGVKGDDGLFRGYDWLKYQPTESDYDRWHAAGCGVGIRTGAGLVAVDIDTLDHALAVKATEDAIRMLGVAPVRVGRAPKCLLLYRTADTVPYRRVRFDGGIVELLSDDRQFVADGTHPITRRPYEWHPYAQFRTALTPVTAAQLDAFFAHLAATMPAAAQEVGSSLVERSAVDQAQLAGNPDTVARAVAALPNDASFKSRDDYIRVGHAIKGATLDDPDRGLELFQAWAARWEEGENDPDVVEADWHRMRAPFSVGAQYLYSLAERHSAGAFTTAEAWFDEQPAPASSPFDTPAPNAKAQLEPIRFVDPADWTGRRAPVREWEVDGLIPRGEVTLLYGDGGVGKTLLAHQYAVCAASGKDWLGQRTRAAKVLCVFCEDGEAEIQRRNEAIFRSLSLVGDAAKGRLRIAPRSGFDNVLATANRGAMTQTPFWHQLRADIESFQPGVVILDTLADVFGGSEIDRSQVNQFMKHILAGLVRSTGASLLVLGHPSVAGKSEGRSGSTAWSNAARSRLFLEYSDKKKPTLERDLRGMKSNYAPAGTVIKVRWHQGAFVAVAERRPGVDLDTLRNSPALPAIDSVNEQRVLLAVAEAERDGRALTLQPRASSYAPRQLKTYYPEHLEGLSADDILDAVVGLERRRAIRPIKIKTAQRNAAQGYAVVAEKFTAGDKMSTADVFR